MVTTRGFYTYQQNALILILVSGKHVQFFILSGFIA